MIGPDPGLPSPKGILQDPQEGSSTHPHLPAGNKIKGTDRIQQAVEDHQSQTVQETVADQQATPGAEMEVRIQLTATQAT